MQFVCVEITELAGGMFQYWFTAVSPAAGQSVTYQAVTNSATSYTVGTTYTLSIA
jgi:hypothetical protein